MRKIIFLFLAVCSFFDALAYRVSYGSNVNINSPVYEDLYLVGGNITINAVVYGDLIIIGGTIIINDTVTSDIILLGGNVTFNGFVGDDIRCAGGNILINRNIIGDVVMAGGDVTIDKTVSIGGLIAAGGNMIIEGDIKGEIRGWFGDLIINGNIAKNMDCRGGKITINGSIGGKSIIAATNIILGNNANFNGDIRYWNKKGSLDFKQTLVNSKAIYDPTLRIRSGQWYYLGAANILGFLWYLGMAFLMILIIQYLFSSTMKKAADTVYNYTLKSLGFGFLFFIAVPIIAVIAFLTVIGVPVGLLLLIGYITLILFITIIISVVAANWLNNRNNYKWGFWRLSLAALGVFILLKLISISPYVGWLIVLLMSSLVFGAILLNVQWKGKKAELVAQ